MENTCPKCDAFLINGVCESCKDADVYYDLVVSALLYEGPTQGLIHHFKYLSFTNLAKWLADYMHGCFETHAQLQKAQLMIPVPLYFTRQKERGYNQSELLAKQLAKKTGIKCLNLVRRTRYTYSQTLLSKEQREHNLDGAFALKGRKSDVQDKSILIIDDVFTTGTTGNQIAALLKKHGAKEVFILTAARAA